MAYLSKALNRRRTPQRQPIPGAGQVQNSAGGFAWAVDGWTRLERFLILGSEGGSYYATEQTLTLENAQAVQACVREDGLRAVRTIVEISEAGRAPKNDPAIFALAVAAGALQSEVRAAALAAVPRVCRTGTHLLHFADFVDGIRGWGRGLRRGIAAWYEQPAHQVALQAVKYQSRDRWSHRDLLRLAHPKAPEGSPHQALYRWIVRGSSIAELEAHPELRLVWAWERAKAAESVGEILELIREHRLPREAVPTRWLSEPEVWEALLPDMAVTALLRNLATLTRLGLLADRERLAAVLRALGDMDRFRRARVHPIAVLSALRTYAAGRAVRGQHTWTPVRPVVDALEGAFYGAFRNVVPTGKRWVLALDVSGSMGYGEVAAVPGLTPRVASAAMALVTRAAESDMVTVGFTAASGGYGGRWGGGDPGMTEIPLGPRERLETVCKRVAGLPMGGTDCALPMLWAAKRKVAADVFVVYTDSETWAGNIHPAQALRQYREQTGISAKLVVVGMVSNGFTIADPNDVGMLDVVGFDTAAPAVIADFAKQSLRAG